MQPRTSIAPDWQRRLSVHEYHRLIEAGVFDSNEGDEHLELLDGVIVTMSPQGTRHARVIQELTRLLVLALADTHAVRVQLPLTLGDWGEPEPDLAVVPLAEAASLESHPTTATLVVEVASDSLAKDRGVKAALYARHGVVEYAIINLVDDCIELYRQPEPTQQRYLSLQTYRRGERAPLESAPGSITLVLDELLGPRQQAG